jgi:hypothetical protein
MKLLYRTAEWHGLAKFRMHTDSSLGLLDELTAEFGKLMRQFRDLTCSEFATTELPREAAARNRRETESLARISRTIPLNAAAGVLAAQVPLVPLNAELSQAAPSGISSVAETSIPIPVATPNREFQPSILVAD